jgi:hypothetical protein
MNKNLTAKFLIYKSDNQDVNKTVQLRVGQIYNIILKVVYLQFKRLKKN